MQICVSLNHCVYVHRSLCDMGASPVEKRACMCVWHISSVQRPCICSKGERGGWQALAHVRASMPVCGSRLCACVYKANTHYIWTVGANVWVSGVAAHQVAPAVPQARPPWTPPSQQLPVVLPLTAGALQPAPGVPTPERATRPWSQKASTTVNPSYRLQRRMGWALSQ